MERMKKKALFFLEDESGATAIEYAFIALFISLAIIVGVRIIGLIVGETFNDVADGFEP